MKVSQKIKKMHKATGAGLSLKQFARELQAKGDLTGVDWFKNKGPSQRNKAKADRLKAKGSRIAAEKAATKAARTKTKR